MPSFAGRHKICHVLMGAEATAADTDFMLVDLSDTTNFPHNDTNEIHLLQLGLTTEKASDGAYDIWVGVVTEADGTNGSVEWIHVWHLEASGNPTDSTDRFVQVVPFSGHGFEDGWNLNVDTTAGSEKLRYVGTYASTANSDRWQTDTGLASIAGAAAGATGKPGAGDLVCYVEEVSGTGTIDWAISVTYFTT